MADDRRLWRGSVAWAGLSPTRGREQTGRRPVLVVASEGYLDAVTSLVVVLPVTMVGRGWPNHVALRGAHGLDRPSWAMTEQVRTIARDRLVGVAGLVDDATLADIDVYLRDFLGL
ncbi:type II toxin-antitoxin system PemK/MazF family toxin [Cellulomonas sp. KRMCY2]|uniref:type II toxin-antitoxin system PemK/MazF family toxin n=1 Tax=Cellulomonas sp. KRMCY2 TaxID=1304865 RepID=UPI00045E5C05|nr:type II toxin-antitoxin system PemK/MazF family toxin [Cellulomonas sp. KRMCY2]